MPVQLKNPILLMALHRLGDASERRPALFSPFHALVRRILLHALIPMLGLSLRLRAPGLRSRLLPRSSLLTRGFNAFYSDVDLTLVVDDSGLARVPQLVGAYRGWKRVLPQLGELEVYTGSEWEALARLKAGQERVVQRVWNLRKLRWQLEARRLASDPYHRRKAERSIRRLCGELGLPGTSTATPGNVEVSNWLRELAEYRGRPAPRWDLDMTSNYLGWSLERAPAEFVGILPDAESALPREHEALRRLRRRPEVAAMLTATLSVELLLTRSKGRIDSSERNPRWESYLGAHLLKYAPEHLQGPVRSLTAG